MTLVQFNAEVGCKPAITRRAALIPLVVLVVTTLLLAPREPSWAFMWVLAFAMWAGCKWAMFVQQAARTLPVRDPLRLLGWIAWPGMNLAPFLDARGPTPMPALRDWGFGAATVLIGAVLVWGASRTLMPNNPMAAAWLGGIGLILMLHFGSFHLLALAWRTMGVPVRPLMQNPLAATSLGEFWGRRWNTAFEELAHRFVFAPLARRHGLTAATLASFAISGIIHDLVISAPARGGYGLPTAYFLVQGAGMLFERSRFGSLLELKRGVRGWLFTMLVTLGPVFWLFHPMFMREVMLPFLRVLTHN